MATAGAAQSSPLHRLAVVAGLGRRTVAETAAGVQVLLGAAVVLAAAERRSVLASSIHGRFTLWFAGPLQGMLPTLPRSAAPLHRDLRMALFAMVAAWLVVVLGGRTVRSGVVIGAVVALHAVFLLSPPLALSDLFNYLGYARLEVLHHANPYVQLPLAGRGDPVYAYSNWHRLRSPYGPLFTLLLLPTAKLPLPVAYWVYKILATAASLGLPVLLSAAGLWVARRHAVIAAATALTLVAALAVPAATSLRLVRAGAGDSAGAGNMPAAVLHPLSAYLRAHQGTARYEVAGASIVKAASLIIRDARPVLTLAGVYGRPLLTPGQLEHRIRAGEVRYALIGHVRCTRAGVGPGCAPVVRWVRSHGTDVSRAAGLPHRHLLYRLPAA